MEVLYEDQNLERICTNEREMLRRRADIADRLRTRVNALDAATTVGQLTTLDPLGRWHPLTANRRGTWAGKLSANHRLIIRPEGDGEATDATTVTVTEIIDYHNGH